MLLVPSLFSLFSVISLQQNLQIVQERADVMVVTNLNRLGEALLINPPGDKVNLWSHTWVTLCPSVWLAFRREREATSGVGTPSPAQVRLCQTSTSRASLKLSLQLSFLVNISSQITILDNYKTAPLACKLNSKDFFKVRGRHKKMHGL